jgi:hypothetical protein
MLQGEEVVAYCRMLYTETWTSSKPGRITMCDAQAQAIAAAEQEAAQDGGYQ